MSMSTVDVLKSMNISLDQSKIKKHPAEPTDLELMLTESEGQVEITLAVTPFHYEYGNIKQWNDWDIYDAGAKGDLKKSGNTVHEEFKRRRANLKKIKKEALAVYEKVAEAIKKGDYVIHLYGNGEVKVDVKY